MITAQAKDQLLNSTQIKSTNLSHLTSAQIKELANKGETTISLADLEAIFVERNERASKNIFLNQRHTAQVAEIARLTKELEERQKGSNLYSILKKSLSEMSEEELLNLGLVTRERANERLAQMREASKVYKERLDKAYREITD
jgi:hypothetical protein